MASVRHLEFEKFRFFFSNFHARNGNLHLCTKFWSKSVKLQLKYGDKAIVKMAAVHHLECSKIAVLVTCPVLPRDSKFRINRPIRHRDIAKKTFSIWRPSAILNLKNFDFCLKYILGMEMCIG